MLPQRAALCLCALLMAPAAWSQAPPGEWWQGDPFAFAAYGAAVTAIDNLDRDGLDDMVVGAPFANTSAGPDSGRIHAVSAADGRLLWTLGAEAEGERFGSALARIGDVDRDGVCDLAVGAWRHGPDWSGRVYLVSGHGRALWAVDGVGVNEEFGRVLCGPGDLNGDGIPDVAVGAWLHDGEAGENAGRVVLLSGHGFEISHLDGQAQGDWFGASLAAPGDLDGDGLADLLVGTPQADGPEGLWNAGRAQAFSGLGHEILRMDGPLRRGRLGTSVAALGDLDNDGRSETAIGAPGAAYGAGLVVVVDAHGMPLWTLAGGAEDEALGSALAGGGDLDGDGLPDLLAGGRELVRALTGTGNPLWTASGPGSGTGFGKALAILDDVNGDNTAEAALGAPFSDDPASLRPRSGVLELRAGQGPRLWTADGSSWVAATAGWEPPPTATAEPADDGVRRYGHGCWNLAATWRNSPNVSTDHFEIGLRGAPPFAPAFLLVGASDSFWGEHPLPLDLGAMGRMPRGCVLFADPALLIPITTDEDGRAAAHIRVSSEPWLVGVTHYAQWAVRMPWPHAWGWALSDALQVTVRP